MKKALLTRTYDIWDIEGNKFQETKVLISAETITDDYEYYTGECASCNTTAAEKFSCYECVTKQMLQGLWGDAAEEVRKSRNQLRK